MSIATNSKVSTTISTYEQRSNKSGVILVFQMLSTRQMYYQMIGYYISY